MYPPPPYVLLLAGLLAALASGIAFNSTLQASVHAWNKHRSSRAIASLKGLKLQLPFFGICAGVCVFLASGVQSFGFSARTAYAMGIPLTVLSALLIWRQLGRILQLLEEGGSRALDLDAF